LEDLLEALCDSIRLLRVLRCLGNFPTDRFDPSVDSAFFLTEEFVTDLVLVVQIQELSPLIGERH